MGQTRWGGLYRSILERAVDWFDTFFGSKFSIRAFAICLVIAVVYAYLGYWLAYSLGASGNLATTELLAPRRNPMAQVFIGLGLVTACLGAWWVGYLGGRLERWRRLRWLKEYRWHSALGSGYAFRGVLIAAIAATGAAFVLYHSTSFDPKGSVLLLNIGYIIAASVILPMFFFMRRRRLLPSIVALPTGAAALVVLVFLVGAAFTVIAALSPVEKPVDNLLPATFLIGGLALAVAGAFAGLGAAVLAAALVVAWTLGTIGIASGAVTMLPDAGIGGLANGAAVSSAAAIGVAQGLWRRRGRLAWIIGVGVLWIVPLILLYSPERANIDDGPRPIILLFSAFFIVIPLFNAAFDWISWLWTRWLAEHLRKELRTADRTESSTITIFWHTLGDLVLAVISTILLVWFLTFAFEIYGQAGWAGPIETQRAYAEDSQSYVLPMIEEVMAGPWHNSVWIWLMLLSTLVPTLIHFAMLIFAPLAIIALPDQRRRDLIAMLRGFETASPEERRTTVRKTVTYFAYERRITWGAAFACVLLGPIGFLIGIAYIGGEQPLEYIANGLYGVALNAIRLAQWLMCGGICLA